MLNHAPKVYTPVEPEDNGIALPVILSLMIHATIIAFIVFSHHIPNIKTPPSIETSIITPEELAQMQAQISANRTAMVNDSQVATTPAVDSNYQISATTVYQPRPTGSDSTVTKGISSLFNEQTEQAMPDINPFKEDLTGEPIVNNPFDVEEETSTETEPTKHSARVKNNFSSEEITSTLSTKGNNSNTDINSTLISLIQKEWHPPKNRVGTKVAVSVTVDDQGNVITAVAHTTDHPLKQSLEDAVFKSSPLSLLADSSARRIKLNFVVE